MCINFTNPQGNKCQWGFYCTHAHGQDDIRNPNKKSTPNGSATNIGNNTTNNTTTNNKTDKPQHNHNHDNHNSPNKISNTHDSVLKHLIPPKNKTKRAMV